MYAWLLISMILLAILTILLAQNVNNSGKTYFFKVGKNNNEFKVNNRIFFLNHNITDYDYNYKKVDNFKQANVVRTEEKTKEYDSKYFLDEEWNYDHENISKIELPLFIHKFYKDQSEDKSSSKHTLRFLFNTNKNKLSRIIDLNLNTLQPEETIVDADLYFYWPLKNTSAIYKESVVLRLYQIERQSTGDFNESDLIRNPDVHKLFTVIYVSKARKAWMKFTIKKPIDNWLNGEENLGLLLTISNYDNNTLVEVFNDTNDGIYSTFAVVKVQRNDTLTNSFDTSTHNQLNAPRQCQRKEWNISFQWLEWDNFIISPDGFTAFDCAGSCAAAQEDNTNHAKLLRIFNKRASCCVPVGYQPLPIMYYDKFGNVIIKNYDNVIVNECGCL